MLQVKCEFHSHVWFVRFFSFLWHFGPILCHGLSLRGFTITSIGHTTFGRSRGRLISPIQQQHTTLTKEFLSTDFESLQIGDLPVSFVEDLHGLPASCDD
jgi:hypothetical protein